MSLLNANQTQAPANQPASSVLPAHIRDWFKVNSLYYGDGKGNFDTLDSLERLELNMSIEDEFSIIIVDDRDTEKLKSIDDYVKFVETCIEQQRKPT